MNDNITVTDFKCVNCGTKKYLKGVNGRYLIRCACKSSHGLSYESKEDALSFLKEIAILKKDFENILKKIDRCEEWIDLIEVQHDANQLANTLNKDIIENFK